jgi:hypothetical protein
MYFCRVSKEGNRISAPNLNLSSHGRKFFSFASQKGMPQVFSAKSDDKKGYWGSAKPNSCGNRGTKKRIE